MISAHRILPRTKS